MFQEFHMYCNINNELFHLIKDIKKECNILFNLLIKHNKIYYFYPIVREIKEFAYKYYKDLLNN